MAQKVIKVGQKNSVTNVLQPFVVAKRGCSAIRFFLPAEYSLNPPCDVSDAFVGWGCGTR